MAVTKTRALVALSSLSLVMILSFQNCAVELSDATFGAASGCEPSADELAVFDTPMTTILQSATTFPAGGTGCAVCHLTSSGNPAAATFPVVDGAGPDAQKTNYCTAIVSAAPKIKDGFLSSGHPGGAYSDSDVQALLGWAATIQ